MDKNYIKYYKDKRLTIIFEDDMMVEMEELKQHYGVKSKADVVRLAVRNLYKEKIKKFK